MYNEDQMWDTADLSQLNQSERTQEFKPLLRMKEIPSRIDHKCTLYVQMESIWPGTLVDTAYNLIYFPKKC